MHTRACAHMCARLVWTYACEHSLYVCVFKRVCTRVQGWCVQYTVSTLCLCVSTHSIYTFKHACVHTCA